MVPPLDHLRYKVDALYFFGFAIQAKARELVENRGKLKLDTDYNGMVFMARQVFFPKTAAWDNLQKSLKACFDDAVWDHLAGITSESFLLGSHRRIAVKVIDERGNELMVVREAA